MKAKQCIAAMVTAGCVLGVAPAVASAAEPQQAASGNWAGYVVNDSNGKTFKSVSASWTQPTANCTRLPNTMVGTVRKPQNTAKSSVRPAATAGNMTSAGGVKMITAGTPSTIGTIMMTMTAIIRKSSAR